jgi:hypothetical protein
VSTKGLQRILPKGGVRGLFGWHLVGAAAGHPLSSSSSAPSSSSASLASSAHASCSAAEGEAVARVAGATKGTEGTVRAEEGPEQEHQEHQGQRHRHIIITEGEYDAMAVYQGLRNAAAAVAASATVTAASTAVTASAAATTTSDTAIEGASRDGEAAETPVQLASLCALPPASHPLYATPAVSLPNGCNSLPAELLPLLQGFHKIYLWLDADDSGKAGCVKIARKLGPERCVVVRPPADMKVRRKLLFCATA